MGVGTGRPAVLCVCSANGEIRAALLVLAIELVVGVEARTVAVAPPGAEEEADAEMRAIGDTARRLYKAEEAYGSKRSSPTLRFALLPQRLGELAGWLLDPGPPPLLFVAVTG